MKECRICGENVVTTGNGYAWYCVYCSAHHVDVGNGIMVFIEP